MDDLLTSWSNQVVMVDATRSRRLGIGQHGRKTDRIEINNDARLKATLEPLLQMLETTSIDSKQTEQQVKTAQPEHSEC